MSPIYKLFGGFVLLVLLFHDGSSQPAKSMNYVGADGHRIVLDHNENAKDVTFAQVIDFIRSDDTDKKDYELGSFTCGDFAECVQHNAEAAGIKCAWVSITFSDKSSGHACNAFNTTDKGLVYIDCTNDDTYVVIVEGNDYIPEPIDNDGSWYESVGKIESVDVYW